MKKIAQKKQKKIHPQLFSQSKRSSNGKGFRNRVSFKKTYGETRRLVLSEALGGARQLLRVSKPRLSPGSAASSSSLSPGAGTQKPRKLETAWPHWGAPPKVRYINILGKSERCLRAWLIMNFQTLREIKNDFIVFCNDREWIKCNLNNYSHH